MYTVYEFVEEFFLDYTNQPMAIWDRAADGHVWEGDAIWEIPEKYRNYEMLGMAGLDNGVIELSIDSNEY